MAPYDAVTFDFWNTLVPETSEAFELRRTLWGELLAEAGHTVAEKQIEAAFKAGWEFFEARWQRNEQSRVDEVASAAALALPTPVSSSSALGRALGAAYLEASEETPRVLMPDVEETFDRLRGLGLKVGVICDVGIIPSETLRRWLDELGVHHLVNHFSFSDVVGVYKPHADMFHHALRGLGVSDPSRAAHVGDLKRTDIAGARGVGMTSVRYTGARVDEAEGVEADIVVDNHLAVLNKLGLR